MIELTLFRHNVTLYIKDNVYVNLLKSINFELYYLDKLHILRPHCYINSHSVFVTVYHVYNYARFMYTLSNKNPSA